MSDIIVPAAVTPLIVVAEDQGVLTDARGTRLVHGAHPVEVLSDLAFHDLILLILLVFGTVVKMELVKVNISADVTMPFHVE